ncbi:nuclear transport factor 2 family protein [Flavobacterium sp. 7A]|uniref:nuclear transport factor 2 family protein n=1 Tax=Flavobacterium sp. 7A TaxID=2940571 RepID=UPI00222774ED|nr:nuclear transport factor 2 family protein [Flavobacterium sp. 7A]MCW2118400.1 putative SnoaL-like aldol condensation-catalyzing enzyme [Flavobacterium sp. 7A]
MTAKELVLDFYKSDALIDCEVMKQYIHPDIHIDWNNSNGFLELNYEAILAFTSNLSSGYVRSKAKISHIIAENNLVSVHYSHVVKTIENPREDMLVGHFMVIWEIKDNKLFRGFQISQKP